MCIGTERDERKRDERKRGRGRERSKEREDQIVCIHATVDEKVQFQVSQKAKNKRTYSSLISKISASVKIGGASNVLGDATLVKNTSLTNMYF